MITAYEGDNFQNLACCAELGAHQKSCHSNFLAAALPGKGAGDLSAKGARQI